MFPVRYELNIYSVHYPEVLQTRHFHPVLRWVRIPPPQSLRVVRGDEEGRSLRRDGNVWLLVLSDRVGCVAET
jgi:hypothetical protein